MHGYEYTLRLNHDEVPGKTNIETGEYVEVKIPRAYKRSSNKISNSVPFNSTESFQRTFTKAWQLLETQTTDKELAVANKLAKRAKAYTGSLEPISPESTVTEIAEELNINRNSVNKIIDKLFKLGVIGKFEVYEINEDFQKYWLFNPYLSFNGNYIKKSLGELFKNTYYAQVSQNTSL